MGVGEAVAYSLLSVLAISLISLIGIFSFALSNGSMMRVLLFLVSFAAGSFLGSAFLHLLPEASEETGFNVGIGLLVLAGVLLFFVLEKFIHWRHCHVPTSKKHPHPLAYMNLVGDAFHNFIDGVIIAVSYLVSIPLGIATSLAVIFHEIPQEISDFGVMLHGGFSKRKALLMNFLTALTAFLGVAAGFLLFNASEYVTMWVLPITAGGFIYIAGTDLIPELHKECALPKSFSQLSGLLLGVLVMFLLLLVG